MEILNNLLYTPGMKYIWRTLLAEDRKKGGFLYPVKGSTLSADPFAAQERACGEVLKIAFGAARDRRAAVKESEIEAERTRLLSEVRSLRDLADQLAAVAVHNPAAATDAAAALRMALIRQEQVQRILAEFIDGNDPIVIRNERGDIVVRGVQITIAEGLREIYGQAMYGISTRLTRTALKNEEASVQAPRSVVQRQRLLQR